MSKLTETLRPLLWDWSVDDPASCEFPPEVGLFRISPPYAAVAEALAAPPRSCPRGSVLLVEPDHPERIAIPTLARGVRSLRATTTASVVLRLRQVESQPELRLASSALAIGFGGVVLRRHPLDQALRCSLTAPLDPAGEWIRWIRLRAPVPAKLRDTLHAVLGTAPLASDVPDLCRRVGVPTRTLTHQLHSSRLPRLERWYDGARLLYAELALQRDPELSIHTVAEALGYADDLSFSNRFCRLFGATPAVSRRLLGLDWRFHEWWKRSCRLQ